MRICNVPHHRQRRTTAIALLLSALICGSAWAQDNTDAAALSLADARRRSAAVASVLDMPRETPAQQLQAVITLLDLGEPDVAELLWSDFSATDLSDEDKAALVKQFGTARFLNLARRGSASGLDGAREFAESSLQVAATINRDPAKLAKLIAALDDQSLDTRRAARSDLAVTGDAGAIACLEALAQATTGEDGEQLRTELLLTLARMRPGVEPLLTAALADGEGQFRRDVIELAGYLHLHDAVSWLAAIASGADAEPKVVAAAHAALAKMGLSSPRGSEARAVVLGEMQRLQSHQYPPEIDTWWTYDPATKKLAATSVSAKEHQLLAIARLSRLLGELPEATPEDQRLMLIYAYQVADLLERSPSSEVKQAAESLTTVQLSDTLHEAIDRHLISAAIACVELLGNRAEVAALSSVAGLPSPLAKSLVHPNRELRFAALDAVMKIKPTRSFAGASGVTKALWYFAASAGEPQAVVASSLVGQASDWAGQLRGMGYEAMPVTTGRQTLLAALNSPRLELMLIDSDINRPSLREVIFALRSNPPLANVPIAVLSSLPNLSRAEQVADQDPLLLATPRPHTSETMQATLDELRELQPQRSSADQRAEQAKAALTWIAELLENGHPYDELLRDADRITETLYDPELTTESLRVLSALGTANSQRQLVDVASTPTLPIETRQAAGEAFRKSVERFGKLLTADEILRQYDRYNASETADEQTQKVLGDLLDVLEKMTRGN